jgi:hypothetical protein
MYNNLQVLLSMKVVEGTQTEEGNICLALDSKSLEHKVGH